MTLKYLDDEVTDEKMRQLNLQAACQHMMEQDAQQPTTPLLFQQPQDPVQTQAQEEDRYIPDGQNTRLSQVSQKQTTYLPDGIPSFRMQIPYLSRFFSTHWYLVQKDTYAMYAIYDALFSEIPYSTQLTPFDLVALDTDLREHLEDRSSHINARWDWVMQISDSYSKWIEAAAVSKNFP